VGCRSDGIRTGPRVPRFAPSLGGGLAPPAPPELLEGDPRPRSSSRWARSDEFSSLSSMLQLPLHFPPPLGAPPALLLPRRELEARPKR
jgi:hypothetical protein